MLFRSIAEFGLLLKDSKYKGGASHEGAISRAESAYGDDENGYRKEFVELMKKAKTIKKN